MDKWKTLLRLYKIYAKMDLLWFLRDTRYCLLYMSTDLICLFCSMAGIFLLSARFGGFGKMTEPEVLFMLGYATLVDGIYMMFFMGNNTSMVSRIIGRGQLDHAVIQPVPVWMHLLCQGFSPVSANSTLICGILITGYALKRLPVAVSLVFLLLLTINAMASCLIIMAVIYLISCLAFYAPAAAEEIAQSGLDLFSVKAYPLGGLGERVKLLFCTAIPVGMGAWFPSMALLQYGYGICQQNADSGAVTAGALTSVSRLAAGEFSPLPSLMAAPCIAILLIVITAILFQKGMIHYETNGSPRYSGFGHR